MSKRQRAPEVDVRAEFVDSLMRCPAATRAAMAERRQAFWQTHAMEAARQLVQREADVRAASRQDLPGAWLRERMAQRGLREAAHRAGLDEGELLEAARGEAARQASERTEGQQGAVAGIVAEDRQEVELG